MYVARTVDIRLVLRAGQLQPPRLHSSATESEDHTRLLSSIITLPLSRPDVDYQFYPLARYLPTHRSLRASTVYMRTHRGSLFSGVPFI